MLTVVLVARAADGDALALVDELARAHKVVVVGCADDAAASRFAAAGARAVVPASQAVAELCKIIGEDDAARRDDVLAALSPRERQVFELLIAGATNVAIAHRLGISRKTADTHRTHVFRKIGVHSAVHLVRFAAQHGLLRSGVPLMTSSLPSP